MSDYDAKSCNALEKPYYTPIEVAIRWCSLIAHEVRILSRLNDQLVPSPGMFPEWPCLRANAERVWEAVLNNELPYGRDGRTVASGEHVAKLRMTIRHADLKDWMLKRYPGQKPAFLFDETERQTHAAINADSFRALQADRDALKQRLEKAKEEYLKLKGLHENDQGELQSLRKIVEQKSVPSDRAETTYLNIIGGLLHLLLGKTPADKPQSVFGNQAAVISAMLAHHEGKPGISARTLEEKFPAAKRSLES